MLATLIFFCYCIMASLSRAFYRCRSLNCRVKNIIMSQNVSTSARRRDKLEEELRTNPFFDKYASKISALQETAPNEFVTRLEANDARKQPKSKTKSQKSIEEGKAKPDLTSTPHVKSKTLDSVMKVDLLSGKTADEIKDIWLQYHKEKDSIAAALTKQQYDIIYQRGKEFPTFLLPLPRNDGYEFIVCQFQEHEVHFTPLISYQTHKENSPECLTIIHYPDLKDEKDIILMQGEFDKNIISVNEAQCLANELQLYYGQNDEKRISLLRTFTHSPQEFKHMDLISELECLSIKS